MAMLMQILQLTRQSRRGRELRKEWVEFGKATLSPMVSWWGQTQSLSRTRVHERATAADGGHPAIPAKSVRGARLPGNQTRGLHRGLGPPTQWAPHPAQPQRSLAGETHARLPQLWAAVQMQSVILWYFWFCCFCKRQRKSVG